LSETYADISTGRLWYEERGSGPAVLLLHSGVADARIWDQQMDPLAKSYRVVRYDARAFGRSDAPTGPFSPVREVGELLDWLGIEQVALVGNSMGGVVATEFALDNPERVTALVLAGTGLRGWNWPDDSKMDEQEMAALAGDDARAVDLIVELWGHASGSPEDDAKIRSMALASLPADRVPEEWWLEDGDPPIDRLGDLRVPTLVIVGDQDSQVIKDIADHVATALDAPIHILRGVDHYPSMRASEEFNRLTLEFLARHHRT
jgi:3-oxoadipate enol-lactonase